MLPSLSISLQLMVLKQAMRDIAIGENQPCPPGGCMSLFFLIFSFSFSAFSLHAQPQALSIWDAQTIFLQNVFWLLLASEGFFGPFVQGKQFLFFFFFNIPGFFSVEGDCFPELMLVSPRFMTRHPCGEAEPGKTAYAGD